MVSEHEVSEQERKKSMLASKADGAAFSLSAGVGDAFVPAAIVQLGATNFEASLVTALPQLFGGISQFFALFALKIAKSRKRLVIAAAILQALSWLPIAFLMLAPSIDSIPAIIALFSLGFAFNMLANPAWSSWISDIVPENERAGFFSDRNRIMQGLLFAATFCAGLALRQMQLSLGERLAYFALFLMASAFRLVSAFFISKMADAKYEMRLLAEIRFRHLFLLPAYKKELWFLLFIGLYNFSVQFASPFFTPYMLNNLGLDVGIVGVLIAASVFAKVIAYPYWGKAIDIFGNRMVLVSTAFGTILVPLLWLFSKDPFWLLIFQIYSGFVWAGFDLSSFGFALGLVGRELRPSFISKYNAFSSFANAAGAMAGGAFLALFPSLNILGFEGILLAFLLSGILRLATSLAFATRLSSSREPANKASQRAIVFNLVAVYPAQGAVSHVLNGWNFTREIVLEGAMKGERMLMHELDAAKKIIEKGKRSLESKIGRKKRL
jgi:MFS family permease